jgi:hypothetical protein
MARFISTCPIWDGSAEAVRQPGGKLDVFANEPPQHRLKVADDLVQVEYPGLQHLLATEGEQLAGQGGCLLAGV